jgi:putative transposase
MSTTTIKCRLYPDQIQREKLEQTLDGCRWVYNYFRTQKNLSVEDMQFALTELKESHPWLRNYHSKMLQMIVRQIDAARKALKTLAEHGRKTGRLKYSKECNTFVYNQSGFRIERHGNTDLLWLSKVGFVEIRLLHKQPSNNIKQISVTRKPTGRWFANIVCEEEARQLVITPRIDISSKCVGIDVGITKFVHDSDNREVENPQFLKKMLKPLRRIDRKVSRRQFGSSNYQKAKHMRARLWERIYNKRHDFLHKVSTAYSKRYDLIFLERLQIPNMVKNHHLARSVLDSGWGYFKSMLKYKAKAVIEVNSAFTSVDCSKCGNKVQKSLAARTHRCDKCGIALDRGYNASLNILQRGRRAMLCLSLPLLLPMGHREVTPVEILWGSQKQEESSGLVQR